MPCRFRPYGLLLLLLVPVLAGPAGATTTEILGEVDRYSFDYGGNAGLDMNGDGYADLAVGTLGPTGSDQGRVDVFFGGPNPDSTADFTVWAELSAIGDWFGRTLANAGDVNGDGYDDLLVGAPLHDGTGGAAGKVYLYFGGTNPDTVADWSWDGIGNNDHLGEALATMGDANGDGYDDFAVGVPQSDASYADGGEVLIFFGGFYSAYTPAFVVDGLEAGALAGSGLSGGGDVDGDGLGDLVITEPGAGGGLGQVRVVFGGTGSQLRKMSLNESDGSEGEGYASAVAANGDLNGDGFADVVVSDPLYATTPPAQGRFYVYLGGSGFDTQRNWVLNVSAVPEPGSSLDFLGDVNGDGYDDLGAAGNVDSRLLVFAGRTYASPYADWQFQREAGAYSPRPARLGDWNGDGRDDVLFFDSGIGHRTVYGLYPYRVISPGPGTTWLRGEPASIRWEGGGSVDLDLSADGGLSWTRVATGVGGSLENEVTLTVPQLISEHAMIRVADTGETPTPATAATAGEFRILPPASPISCKPNDVFPYLPSAGQHFGETLLNAGDVNGDGYDDILVGGPYFDSGGLAIGRVDLYSGQYGFAMPIQGFSGFQDGDRFGYSLAAGDMNGDGYNDVVVGADLADPPGTTNGGVLALYLGSSSWASSSAYALYAGPDFSLLGRGVAMGDLNGDGYDDVAVGAPGDNQNGYINNGSVYIMLGGAVPDVAPDITLFGFADQEDFGSSVAILDTDSDGRLELLVGAPGHEGDYLNQGAVYRFQAPFDTLGSEPDLVIPGGILDMQFGGGLAALGDVNGDGFGDFGVGGAGNPPTTARMALYGGGPEGPRKLFTLVGDQGEIPSMTGGGDLNGDGIGDFAVGFSRNATNGLESGRAVVFHGSPTLDDTPDEVVLGHNGEWLGKSLAMVDVHRDGLADLLIGTPRDDTVDTDAGRVIHSDCARYHLGAPQGGAVWNVGAEEAVSWTGATVADLRLSIDGGATYFDLATGVGGAAQNYQNLTVPNVPTRFARLQLVPHDPEVDGFATSDSLFTVEASVALLNLSAQPAEGGILLSWETNPGPEDLEGYKVERRSGDEPWLTIVDHLRESRYLDATGRSGMRYRLTAVNGLGAELFLGEIGTTPRAMLAAWPLPFRSGNLSIRFLTASGPGGTAAPAEVGVYDIRGRLVKRVDSGTFPAGERTVIWDGTDASGARVGTGIYFVRLVTGGQTSRLKVAVIR